MFTQAQNLLNLKRGTGDEELRSSVKIEIGVAYDGEEHARASCNTM